MGDGPVIPGRRSADLVAVRQRHGPRCDYQVRSDARRNESYNPRSARTGAVDRQPVRADLRRAGGGPVGATARFWQIYQLDPGAGGGAGDLCLADLYGGWKVIEPGRVDEHDTVEGGAADAGRPGRHPVRARRCGQYCHRRHDADGGDGWGAGGQPERQPVGGSAGGGAGQRSAGPGSRCALDPLQDQPDHFGYSD